MRMSRPACPLFCLLSLCRETPQGLFLPVLRAFGAGAVTKAPQEPALRLKLVLGRGWGDEDPRGVPGPSPPRGPEQRHSGPVLPAQRKVPLLRFCCASALRIPEETPGRMGCSFIFRAMNV